MKEELAFVGDNVRAVTSFLHLAQRSRNYSTQPLKLPKSTRFGTKVILLQRFGRLR